MLICNPVLSRNPFTSQLLLKAANQLLHDETEYKKRIFINLIRYFLKSFAHFLFFFIHFFTFKISKLRLNKHSIDLTETLIVINTFVMIDKIYSQGRFNDLDFDPLHEIMEKRHRQNVTLCFLFGDKPWNLKRRIQTYNILANDRRNFVTEFELMGCKEW